MLRILRFNRACIVFAIALFANAIPSYVHARDPAPQVLVRFDDAEILTGRFSRFAKFQEKLLVALESCSHASDASHDRSQAEVPGRLGSATRHNIKRAITCGAIPKLPGGHANPDGAITTEVWAAVMGNEPPPSVSERAKAMVLSFEATDFGEKPEWNFCADGYRSPASGARGSGKVCYNASDRCSLVTWGPRGATAGSGHEIQNVLWIVSERDPALLEAAFGPEYKAMLRFLRLRGSKDERCDGDYPLKRFLCAIWLDDARRETWESAFHHLGQVPLVRQVYDRLYASEGYDEGTLRDYYRLWSALSLQPTEIDYAFFLDRVTHLGGPPSNDSKFLTNLIRCTTQQPEASNPNAAARRCLSLYHRHKTQEEARRARDVAYYLDAYPDKALTKAELQSWAGFVAITAERNFGLSDDAPFPLPLQERSDETALPVADQDELTIDEQTRCPSTVLFPSQPTR